MKQYTIGLVLSSMIIFCNHANSQQIANPGKWRQAAEYEPTKAVWMLYPQITHKQGYSNFEVQFEMMKAIIPSVVINYIVKNDAIEQFVRQQVPESWLKNQQIRFFHFPYQEFWARDFGPVFITNEKGEKAIADFMFNIWGYSDTADVAAILDEKLDERIAFNLKLPVLSSHLVSEGGNREISSKGVLLVVETVERQRNPHLSLFQMEDEYKRLLGAQKIVWLKQGVRDDDMSTLPPIEGPGGKKYYTMLTTNGHVDEFARFVNDSTILLAWVPPAERTNNIEKQTGERMEINYQILKQSTNTNGQPFHIIKMPMPYVYTTILTPRDSVYKQLEWLQVFQNHNFPLGQEINCVAAASYLNFVIINDRVLVAKYWQKGLPKKVKKRDAEAVRILQTVFPGKTIIPINAIAINFGGGGMHCISMNEPY